MLSTTKNRSVIKAAVIGGGPVGALQACYLAKRGYDVHLYEVRKDIRTANFAHGKSINLSLSLRGRDALKRVGLEKQVIEEGVPVYARGIHNRDSTLRIQPYDIHGQEIVSVNRRKLNESILTKAEEYPNVKIYFLHKLIHADLDEGKLKFSTSDDETVSGTYDIVFGTDGAYSTIREHMMQLGCLNFKQEYILHGYKEIFFPPSESGSHSMQSNLLHIWPRDEFLMIALPNKDHTFTGTLFMPFEKFEELHEQGEEGVIKFFRHHFNDALGLIGEENLKKAFPSSESHSMVSVKCYPYHYKNNKAVLMGDAAHAMVPFYGQGVNCGFEDCVVLNDILDKHEDNFETALPEFSRIRCNDAQAMCDLSMYNYFELRHLVNSSLFHLRARLYNFVYRLFPKHVMPLYNMVAFSRIPYSAVMKTWKRQKQVEYLSWYFILTTLTTITSAVILKPFILRDSA